MLILVKTTTDGTFWLAYRNCDSLSLSIAIYFGSRPFFLFLFTFPLPISHFPFCAVSKCFLCDFWLFNSQHYWCVFATDMSSSSTCPYLRLAWVNPTGLRSHRSVEVKAILSRVLGVCGYFDTTMNHIQSVLLLLPLPLHMNVSEFVYSF